MAFVAKEFNTRLIARSIGMRVRIASLFWSIVVRLWLRVWGAECGEHLQAHGWPIVRRALDSSLKIG